MARYHIENAVTYQDEFVPPQHWIEMPIGNGWVADYLLVFDRRKPESRSRIIEVRLRPEREPGYMPVTLDEALHAKPILPRAPFSFDAIRRYVTQRQFKTALDSVVAAVESPEPTNALRILARMGGGPPPSGLDTSGRRVGRPPKHDQLFFAKFAARYEAVEQSPRREAGDSTRAILARERRATVYQVGKWIQRARRLGFLTPPPKGRGSRGGQATAAAKALIAQQVRIKRGTP
jgi:hypothetical protein